MRVALLGPLEVELGGRACPVAGGRLRALLTRLAIGEGRPVSVTALEEAVWPDDVPSGGANALQSLVSRLRRTLGDPNAVQQVAAGYRLDLARADLDVARFAELVRTGERQLAAGDASAAMATIDEALLLWRGEPLADAGSATYALAERTSLAALRLRAEETRLQALLGEHRYDDAIADAVALSAAHPLDERVAGALLEALARSGRPSEALAAYEQVRARLRDQLGADPGPELQALHLRLLRREVVADPRPTPVATPPARRTNLRAALTSFVGREADLDRALTGIGSHRLTTLLGAGGCGKTRLATEVGRRLLAEDGTLAVWLVELASVTTPDGIVPAVLGALGVRDARVTERSERPPVDARDRLLDRLRDSRCVLIVDNCEHLIQPVAELVDDILAAAPQVRVLATSRELLGLTGELLCALAPLSLPPAEVALREAADHPAVRLWLDRASSVQPEFVLDASTLPAVITIVRRLDGLPLAIELAAARLRVLPASEIADRLSDRFRLLTGGNRTSMPRHRTLRAVVEWSWDLLGPAERLLAERLSVFPGGADTTGVAAVCADHTVPADGVEELLGSLVDKSLVQAEPWADPTGGGVRFRMLETIREYGIERLDERGELADLRLAHAEHYARMAVALEPLVRSREQRRALTRLELDRDNLTTSIRYLLDSGHGDRGLTMVLALAWYWSMLDNTTELVSWARPLLAANTDRDLPDLAYARAAVVLSEHAESGDGERPSWEEMREQLAATAVELARLPPPPFPGLEVLRCMVAAFADQSGVAETMSKHALEGPDPWLRAALRASLASLYENNGELDRMRSEVMLAYEGFRDLGDRWGLSRTLIARGQLAVLDGRLEDAIGDFLAARQQLQELGSSDEDAYLGVRLADALIRCGDLAGARAEVAVLAAGGSGGLDSERELFATTAMIMIEWYAGDTTRARELADLVRHEIAGRDSSEALLSHLRGVLLATTGLVAALSDDVEQAGVDLRIAYPAAVETRDQPIIAAVGASLAAWLTARGRFADAAEALGAAAAVRGADDRTDLTVVLLTNQLTAELGVEFEARYAAGRALDRAEARARLDPERY